MSSGMGPRTHRRAARLAGQAMAAILVTAFFAGGFAIHRLLQFSLDHYRAAAAAAALHGNVGELVGINFEVATAGSVNYALIKTEAQINREMTARIATLQASRFNTAAVQNLANETIAAFDGLDTGNGLLAQGAVTGSDQLEAATLANDATLDALMTAAEGVAGLLQRDADRAGLLAERGVMGAGLGMLAAVATLLTWMGRRRRRAAAGHAERKGLARFEAMVEQGSELSMVTDTMGRRTYVSPAVEHVLGFPRELWSALQDEEIIHPDDLAVTAKLLAEAVATGRSGPTDFRVRHADGSWRVLEVHLDDLSAVEVVGGILWSGRDVTERRRLETELERAAFEDSLTGLANRALFRDRLQHAVERGRRQDQPIAVLLADLDGFKTINDSLGHDAGDEALVEVAARLLTSVRPSDTVARIGGDEFTILLEDVTGPEAAGEVARRLQQVMREPLSVAGREIRLGISVGIAQSGADGTTARDLLRNADMAMYSAKAGGKGRSVDFEPSMFARAEEDLAMAALLDGAVDRGEMEVYYQPTYALGTLAVEGVEALLRWRPPDRGLIAPGLFIPLAERTGQIVPIGLWVLEQACRRAKSWQLAYPAQIPLTVGINLSGRQLADDHIVADVAAVLTITGVEPTSVMLEITESVLMGDVEAVTTKLHKLKALGVRLAVDDFGTGYSSLAYLRQFPVDILKIDRAFVEAAAADAPGGRAMVRAIVDMASSLNLATIAEGIERQEQADFLLGVGCSLGQGFLYARPMPPEDLDRFLALRRRSAAVV